MSPSDPRGSTVSKSPHPRPSVSLAFPPIYTKGLCIVAPLGSGSLDLTWTMDVKMELVACGLEKELRGNWAWG